MTDKPNVIDLSKADSTDGPDSPAEERETDQTADEESESSDGPDAVSDGLEGEYPDDVEDNTQGTETDGPDSPWEDRRETLEGVDESDLPDNCLKCGENERVEGKLYCHDCQTSYVDKEDGGDEKAFDYSEYELPAKVTDKRFQECEKGDMVLIKTPLEGAKVGEVVGTDKAWTGTLHLKVDTGANQYDITPYNDEFSEKFLAVVDESKDVTHDLLGSLGKTSPDAVDRGERVVIDVPTVGAVKGQVAHKTETETQGHKIDVKCGPVYFKIYEEPSSIQRKEQPHLVGKVTE